MGIPYVPPPAIVEVVELNHVYDDEGRRVFSQVILWDWCARDSSHHVRDWAYVDKPPYAKVSGNTAYVPSGRGVQVIKGRAVRETWSQYDREAMDRAEVPERLRNRVIKR